MVSLRTSLTNANINAIKMNKKGVAATIVTDCKAFNASLPPANSRVNPKTSNVQHLT